MPTYCTVSAKVTEVKSMGSNEMLLIKVLKKIDSKNEKCDFIKEELSYTAIIKKTYRGKSLRVPALTPGKLKLNSIFNAKLLQQKGSKQISWSLLKNTLSLPKETSFFTSLLGI